MAMSKLRVFTAFSGYDSQCLALNRLPIDYELVGWSEIDKYAIKGHNALFPDETDRNYGDISKIDWSQVPDFDLFTYSSPCQDFSQAGLQRGGEQGSGTRSSLLWECERAIACKRPSYLLMENVSALVSAKFIKLFHKWLLTLEGYGYKSFSKVLNAKDFGVPQNRERIFVVSIRVDDRSAWESAQYHFPKEIPSTKRLADVLENEVDESYYLSDEKVASLLKETEKQRNKGNGFGFKPKDATAIAGAITTKEGQRKGDNFVKVAASCVTANKRENTQNYVCVNTDSEGNARTINTHYQEMNLESVLGKPRDGYGYVRTAVIDNYRIRKLTERECFRLMGLAENEIDTLMSSGISKTRLYQLAGNSIVVNVLEAIFRKLFIDTAPDDGQLKLF